MTVDKSTVKNEYAFLLPYQFVQLTTFRKSGVGVPTTVWFAPDGDKLYVTTGKQAGKIKRIHNNGKVLLQPCDARGNVLDEREVVAMARELPEEEYYKAEQAVRRKYGAMFDKVVAKTPIQVGRTYIEIWFA